MNREMITLAIAYSYIVSGGLSNKQKQILDSNNIDFKTLNEYINKIKNNQLEVDKQKELERLFNINLNQLNDSSNNIIGKTNSKQKVFNNGKKQLYNDEAAFSDIYLFGFLVLVFQVLFLIISYLIFA